MAGADLVAIPTVVDARGLGREGFPYVGLEALAAGTPDRRLCARRAAGAGGRLRDARPGRRPRSAPRRCGRVAPETTPGERPGAVRPRARRPGVLAPAHGREHERAISRPRRQGRDPKRPAQPWAGARRSGRRRRRHRRGGIPGRPGPDGIRRHASADASPWVLLAVPLAPLLALLVIAAPTVGVVLVFLTFPVGTIDVPTGVFPLQAVEAAVLVIVAVVVVRRLATGTLPLPWSPPLWWAVLLLGWTLLGLQSAIDEYLALKQVASLFGGLLLLRRRARRLPADERPQTGSRSVRRRLDGNRDRIPRWGISSSSRSSARRRSRAGSTARSTTRISSARSARWARRPRWASPSAPEREAGVAAAGAGSLLILVALLFTLSRGAWMGTALALLFLLVALREARRALVLLAVPARSSSPPSSTLLAPVGGTEITVVGERAGALTALSPYDDRPADLPRGLRGDPGRPAHRPGRRAGSRSRARGPGRTSARSLPQHAHNLWLTWGAEAGIPAMIFILGFAVSLGLAARSAGRGSGGPAARATGRSRPVSLPALLAILGQGLFDYVFRNAVVNIALWALIGALLVCRREGQRASGL